MLLPTLVSGRLLGELRAHVVQFLNDAPISGDGNRAGRQQECVPISRFCRSVVLPKKVQQGLGYARCLPVQCDAD